MRTAIQISLILAGCMFACLDLSLHCFLPGLISGQVIDWQTGQPVPDVEVRTDDFRSAEPVVRTDAHGYFHFQPRNWPQTYFLFASSPRYGRLLQATWGQTVVLYRNNQQVRDVIIPAIPATELAGHVYGSDGKPIAGCSISALTRASYFDMPVNLQVQGVHTIMPWDLAEADDPNQLKKVESVKTDREGFYVFDQLGADRYFVSAQCQETQVSPKSPPYIWEPRLYPDVNSLAGAQQILLLPGNHRAGIDFHMQRKRAYAMEGKMNFSDHSIPKLWLKATYFQDLTVFRSDRGLPSTWLGKEACRINADGITFRCESLLPGEYTFYFEGLPGRDAASNAPVQMFKVRYNVQATVKQVLTVKVQEFPNGGEQHQSPYAGPGGNLDFEKICATASDGRPAIQVLAWGQGRAGGSCYYMTLWWSTTRFLLPKGSYRINAFEAAFTRRGRSYLRDSTKFEEVLMQHGKRIELDMGQTTKPSLPVLATRQLIDLALTFLTTAQS